PTKTHRINSHDNYPDAAGERLQEVSNPYLLLNWRQQDFVSFQLPKIETWYRAADAIFENFILLSRPPAASG
ncbi:hypothetical protein, partial [Pseudomonas aeruginosa]|uniref:hypothetical protein n=1 Tax=Pseudomonas aeruginosa TaxID=287 RepID=UPI003F822FA7